MPDLTLVHVAFLAGALLLGYLLGWISRSSRSVREKKSISAGWQAQIDSQQSEHDRLAGQNKSLMQQISQYQASNKDSKMRAKELSDSLKEAFGRRDELQRQLKDIRGNLEVAVTQRDKLQSTAGDDVSLSDALEQRDARIEKLSKELDNWQQRVPPLVERYRQRDLEAQQLEIELQKATDHIATLESMDRGEHTRIEPVDSSNIPDGLDASNEPHTATSILDPVDLDADEYEDLEDQVSNGDSETAGEGGSDIDEEDSNDGEDGSDVGEEDSNDNMQSEDPLPEDWQDEDDGEETGISRSDEYSVPVTSEDEDADIDIDADEDEDEDEDGDQNSTDEAEAFPNVLGDDYATGMREGPDDLRQIKGIGPAIEKTLNDLGIYRFNQIAEMSEYDIDRVAQELKGFRSRIYREDWIGQARTLQQQKNTD